MKKVLYVIIGISLLYFILALFGPSKIVVEREISVNKSAALIREKLLDFKFFHDQWSPWTEKDPAMKTTYEGTPGQVGHLYKWSGNDAVKQGLMKLMEIKTDTVVWNIEFGDKGTAKVNLITKENAGVTNVKWQMILNIGFMGRTPMLFINMDKQMAPDFEKGLAKLKTAMESISENNAVAKYEIKELDWAESNYVGKKETVAFEKMAEFFGKNYQAIGAELGKSKIQPEGHPSAIYTLYDEKEAKADVAAVFKVAKGVKLKGFESFNFPASKALLIEYYGDYAKSANAHYAMDEYMKAKGLSQSAVIEEYVTDPMSEKDTAKWLTNIVYILK
jgi:effector-binding domain-containing protein